jgi:hypothetical protein
MEQHILKVFENRVLRRIFGPKRDKMKGEWRKLHSEELHNLYSSPDIIRQIKSRRMRWAEHVARMGEERKVYKVLMGKPEGKRLLGRPRRRWEDGIRMDLRKIGWGDWIQLAQDRDRCRAVMSAVMNLRVLAPRVSFSNPQISFVTNQQQHSSSGAESCGQVVSTPPSYLRRLGFKSRPGNRLS